jgi:hypothetical protein
MGDGRCHSRLPLEAYALVVGLPRLSVRWEDDEAVLPRHSTPVRWGRMATRPYYCCRPLLPLRPGELWWHSYVLCPRGMTPSLVMLGPRLSIGITIVVTHFIDVLTVRLFLFLLEESPYASRSLPREPLSHGFRVVPLTPLVWRGFLVDCSGGSFPYLFLHNHEVFCGRAPARRSWTFRFFLVTEP